MALPEPTAGDINPPAIPAADQLYDSIMAAIEPDLTTANLPKLKEKYAGETEAESKNRADRYAKAFEGYERQLAEYLAGLSAKVHTYQRSALASLEKEEKESEAKLLQKLDDDMKNA